MSVKKNSKQQAQKKTSENGINERKRKEKANANANANANKDNKMN